VSSPVSVATDESFTPPAPAQNAQRRRRSLRRFLPLLIPLTVGSLVLRQKLFVPVAVVGSKADRGDVVSQVFGRGTLESRREVNLGFDLVGRIEELLVDDGDLVTKGQVMARMDSGQLVAEQQAAQSTVAVAKSAIARLEAEERKANAGLAFATVEAKRVKVLSASGALSTRDLDAATQQLDQARAEMERVRAARAEALRQIAAAGSNVDVRSATASRGVLVAPFDGQVVRRLRDPGDTVSVGSTVLRVVARDSLRGRAWIDDSVLPQLEVGLPVDVRFGATGAASSQGAIDRIGHEADRQTHEIWVDVKLFQLPPRVAVGQRADVWIETGRSKNALRIPSRFVKRDGRDTFCYVGRSGRIQRASLQLGRSGDDYVEVKGGITEGEAVLDSVEVGKPLPEGRKFADQP